MQLCKGKWTCHVLIEGVVVISWIGALLSAHSLLKPKHSGFFCDDRSIQYPYSGSTVGDIVIVCVTLFLPAVVMVLTECLLIFRPLRCCTSLQPGFQRSQVGVWSRVGGYVHYFLGYVLINTAVVVLKNTTGQLRPHFLAVCKPDVNLSTCVGFITDYNCTNSESTDRRVLFARQSFPSGHAACAFYMSLFIILYLDGSAKLKRNPLFRLTLYAVLTLYALWCSATRVIDHMHHVGDVMAGAFLGTLVALATYYRGARDCLTDASADSGPGCDAELGLKKAPNSLSRKCSDPAVNSCSFNMASSLAAATASNNASSNNNNNNSLSRRTSSFKDVDEEDEEDNSEGPEADAPATPTPLLLHQSSSMHSRASFMLERDKNKFRKFSLR